MSVESDVITNAALQLKEAFDTYAIIGIPTDKTAEPVVASSGDTDLLVAALQLAKDKVNERNLST